ncbi:carboxymuconolactone decarboxylase family protein, partial [Paraburkholderia humisilvae]|uniref:carboxymuconolactone decarboxylase family protein n=1 Tax=Paraburkholderia humisilvae TaxID=627669 RepID=UPI001C2E3932
VGGSRCAPLIERLNRLSPAISGVLVETVYCDVIGRPGLSLKDREVATVAVLAAQGNTPIALTFHCEGMLNTGWYPRALIETVVCGVSGSTQGAATAIAIAFDVLMQRQAVAAQYLPSGDGLPPAPETFMHTLNAGRQSYALVKAVLTDNLARLPSAVVDSDSLSEKSRQLATFAAAMVQRVGAAAIRDQTRCCLALGWTREELIELIIHITAYIGWPETLNLVAPTAEAFEAFHERITQPDSGSQSDSIP